MKQNKKGFTLVELLAVILILAIIALIAVPVILNIIDKANKSSFKDTAYGIISAGELYFAGQQLKLNGMETDIVFELPLQANTTDGLQLKGNIPTGEVKITTEGNVMLAIQNGRYCITKGYTDNNITLSETPDDCELENSLSDLVTKTNVCLKDKTEGACASGTLFTIKVNDSTTKNFYVMKDEGEKVTLIMQGNLVKASWYADAKDNSHGPITAINYLDESTDEEWSNIPKRTYVYSGIANDGKTRRYEDITRRMRARMITHNEAVEIVAKHNGTVPGYLFTPQNCWTSTATGSVKSNAQMLLNGKPVANTTSSIASIRPVIELAK